MVEGGNGVCEEGYVMGFALENRGACGMHGSCRRNCYHSAQNATASGICGLWS